MPTNLISNCPECGLDILGIEGYFCPSCGYDIHIIDELGDIPLEEDEEIGDES